MTNLPENSHPPRSLIRGSLSYLWTNSRSVFGAAWRHLRNPETWARALRFLKTTPARLVYLGIVTIIVIASMFLFTSQVYAHLSQLALHRMAIAKWVATAAAAFLALLAYFLSRQGVHGRRRARAITIANLLCLIICYFILDPPPRVPARDIEKLKIINAEHGGVQISPNIDAIAQGVVLSGETDPLILAQGTLARNQLEKALGLLDKGLLDMAPMERVIAETHFYKAIALSRLRRDEDALHEANMALAILPRFSAASALRCKSLRRLGRLEAALAACRDAINENPKSAVAWGERGAVFLSMGTRQRQQAAPLFEKALAALNVSLKADPSDPSPWNNKAVALVHLGRPAEGLKSADTALRLKPDFADAMLNKGTALKRLRRLKETIPIYEQLTRMNPHDTEAWNNLGDAIEYSGGNLIDALDAFDTALETNPEFGDAWFNRGEVLNKLSRYEEALEALVHAVQINPHDDEALVEEAFALEHLGRKAEALAAVDRALALSPHNPKALAAKKRLRRRG